MINLQFSTQAGWASTIIRYCTFSPISHVDLVLETGELLGSRMDGGVMVRSPNYGNFTKVIKATVDADYDKLYAVLDTQIGRPYDYGAIINFGLQRKWREMDSWFCSELIAWGFEQIGIPLINPSIDVWRVTPEDLLKSILVKPIFEDGIGKKFCMNLH